MDLGISFAISVPSSDPQVPSHVHKVYPTTELSFFAAPLLPSTYIVAGFCFGTHYLHFVPKTSIYKLQIKLPSTRAIMMRIFVYARLRPMQFRGPMRNFK